LATEEGIITANFKDGLAESISLYILERGEMIMKDGSIYQGNFKNGQKNGKGVLRNSS
jgi:hypothetical protein